MILTILNTVLGLLVLMGVGFLCSKVGLIDQVAQKKLTNLLLKIRASIYPSIQKRYLVCLQVK